MAILNSHFKIPNVIAWPDILSKSDLIEESVLRLSPSYRESSGHYEWNRSLADVERKHIRRVLEAVHGNRSEASRILGISKPTLYAKLPVVRHEEPK